MYRYMTSRLHTAPLNTVSNTAPAPIPPTTWSGPHATANIWMWSGKGSSLWAALLAPPFLSLLVMAALVDWLVTRTLTRFAIFIPKTEAMITGYAVISWVGLMGSALAALLAWVCLAWIVADDIRRSNMNLAIDVRHNRPAERASWRIYRLPWLALLMAALGVLSIVFLILPPASWLPIYYTLMLIALIGLARRALASSRPRRARLAALIPALAMLAAGLYQALPAFQAMLSWPGTSAWRGPLFQLGELLVIAGALALWGAYGRHASRRIWVVAALLPLLFVAAFLPASAMTATIVVWSNGLTLFLPWWLYAAALWLIAVTVLQRLHAGDAPRVWAILLLLAAGYAPQLSSQFFFGLIALWLLTQDERTQLESSPLRAQ